MLVCICGRDGPSDGAVHVAGLPPSGIGLYGPDIGALLADPSLDDDGAVEDDEGGDSIP